MTWPLDDERQFWRSACCPGRHPRYLWWFLLLACGWETIRQEKPREPLWINDAIVEEFVDWVQLQNDDWYAARVNGSDRRHKAAAIVPRGCGKTHVITIAGNLTLHLREPNMTSTIGSEVVDNASDFLTAIRGILSGDTKQAWFAWLFGVWKSVDSGRAWNATDVVHAARTDTGKIEPSFLAFGVDTGLTSKHPLALDFDDLLSYERLTSQSNEAARTLINSAMYAARSTALVWLVGTRYLEDDPHGHFLRREGVASWAGMPCREKDLQPREGGEWHVFFGQVMDPNGVLMFPSVWPQHRIESERRADPGKFSAQAMNEPTTSEYQPLTRDMLYGDGTPGTGMIRPRSILDSVSIRYATLHADTAFKTLTQLQAGDYNVLVQGLHENGTGRVFVDNIQTDMADDGAHRWSESVFLTHLGEMLAGLQARMIHCRALTIDKPIGGQEGTLENSIRTYLSGVGVRCPQIHWINRPRALERGKNKPARIRASLTYWREGYIVLLDDCPNLGFLCDQVLKVDLLPHDDVADAAADLFLPEVWVRPDRAPADLLGRPPRSPMDDILKAAKPWDTTADMLEDFDRSDSYGRRRSRR